MKKNKKVVFTVGAVVLVSLLILAGLYFTGNLNINLMAVNKVSTVVQTQNTTIDLVNIERAKNNLSPIIADKNLCALAKELSEDREAGYKVLNKLPVYTDSKYSKYTANYSNINSVYSTASDIYVDVIRNNGGLVKPDSYESLAKSALSQIVEGGVAIGLVPTSKYGCAESSSGLVGYKPFGVVILAE